MGKLLQFSFREVLSNSATRIMVMVFLFLSLVTFTLIYFSYQNHLSSAYSSEFNRLEVITNSLALQINANDHKTLLEENPHKDGITIHDYDERYRAIHDILLSNQLKHGIETDIYTLVRDPESQEFRFGVTSGKTPYFRHKWENPQESHFKAFHSGSSLGPYVDQHGTWLSSFSPITIEGETIAIVQADKKFDSFLAEARTNFISTLLIFLVIFLLATLIMTRLINRVLSREDHVKRTLLEQTEVIHKKNSDIMASIRVAKRLQEAVLPNLQAIQRDIPNFKVMYEPKDLVSGDFYWYERVGTKVYLAAGDCTGHGIPGAFMSMMASTALYHVLNKMNGDLGEILTELDRIICKHLHNSKKSLEGMDVAICSYDTSTGEFCFAGALRPMLLINDGVLKKLKGDRVGIGRKQKEYQFTEQKVFVQPGDVIYMFSDGYSDQFGGEKGRKYMSKRFRDFLQDIQEHSIEEQNILLQYEFHLWKEGNEQVDDVLVMGFEIPDHEQRLSA